MKPKAKLTLFSLIPLISLSSCSIIQNGKIEDYEGTYYLSVSRKETHSYYWGEDTLKETTSALSYYFLDIEKDKTATLRTDQNVSQKGEIKIYKDYCKFKGFTIDDSFKFNRGSNYKSKKKTLSYYKKSKNIGFVYDYEVTNIVFEAYIDPNDYVNYLGSYTLSSVSLRQSTKSYLDPTYGKTTANKDDFNNVKGSKLVLGEDKTFAFFKENGSDSYNGTLSFNNRKINLDFTSFPKEGYLSFDLELSWSEQEGVIYLSGRHEETVPLSETYYQKNEYSFSFTKGIPTKYLA